MSLRVQEATSDFCDVAQLNGWWHGEVEVTSAIDETMYDEFFDPDPNDANGCQGEASGVLLRCNEIDKRMVVSISRTHHSWVDGSREIVPANRLKDSYIEDIITQIKGGETSGTVVDEVGNELEWAWDPKIKFDGNHVDFGGLSNDTKEEVARTMLFGGCRGGEFNELADVEFSASVDEDIIDEDESISISVDVSFPNLPELDECMEFEAHVDPDTHEVSVDGEDSRGWFDITEELSELVRDSIAPDREEPAR